VVKGLYLEGALTLDSNEQAPLLPVRVLGVYREVRATHDANLDLAVNNEC
jgi:hypothetical protein